MTPAIVTRFRCLAAQRSLGAAALFPEFAWVTLSTDGAHALPAGRIEMMLLNPAASRLFVPGLLFEVSFVRLGDEAALATS